MSLILYTGNICIPDKSMIKDSTDHHLQTIQHTVIWPRAVYSGRRIHTHTWHSSHSEAGSFTVRQGGLDTTYCFSVLITRTRNQKGRRFTFTTTAECTRTYCCSHTRTMPLQSKHNICSSQKADRCQNHVQKQNSMNAME